MLAAACRSGRRPTVALLVAGAIGTTTGATLAAPIVSSIGAQPAAQPPNMTPRLPGDRRIRFMILGAASGTALATGYYFMSERGERAGNCPPKSCALPYLSISGALAGLFMSRELDAQRRAEAPRAGESLQFGYSDVQLLAAPRFIAARDSLVAVATDSGAQLVSASARPVAVRRRGAGLSDMRQVALVAGERGLIVGTGSSLWESSVNAGQFSRALDGPVDALAASDSGVLTATAHLVRLRRGSGDGARVDSLDVGRNVNAAAYDAATRQWWVATDSMLIEVLTTSAGLKRGRQTVLPAPAVSIASSEHWLAVALGGEGIVAYRRESIGTSVGSAVRMRQEPRFAFDLAFLGNELFVAGGVDGVYRIALEPIPRVIGSTRQVRYATGVREQGGVLWVADGVRNALVRLTP